MRDEDNIDSKLYLEKVKADSRYDAECENPPTRAQDLFSSEQTIVNDCVRVLRSAKNSAESEIDNQKAEVMSYGEKISVEHLIARFKSSISDLKQAEKPHLQSLINERENRETALRSFQSEHKLKRMADYPETRLWSVAMLVTMIVVESVLNANMLAKTSLYGLIGGWAEAIFISMANIFFGFFTGLFPLRYINVRRNKKTYLTAKSSFITCCSFIVIFNFIFAHYRLSASPEVADVVKATLIHIKSAPLAIFLDIKSFALFIVGLAFSALSGWKGYEWDDHFPGYGSVYKKLETAKKNLLDAEDRIREACRKTIENKISELEIKRKELSKILKKPENLISYIKLEQSKFNRFAECINAKMNELIKTYRSVNMEVRKTPPPAYFSSIPEIQEKDMNLEINFKELEDEIQNRKSDLEEMYSAIEETLNEVVELEPVIMTEMTEYFSTFEPERYEYNSYEEENDTESDSESGEFKQHLNYSGDRS